MNRQRQRKQMHKARKLANQAKHDARYWKGWKLHERHITDVG